jgi:hypothetical protein
MQVDFSVSVRLDNEDGLVKILSMWVQYEFGAGRYEQRWWILAVRMFLIVVVELYVFAQTQGVV